jgi:hypothetical protein
VVKAVNMKPIQCVVLLAAVAVSLLGQGRQGQYTSLGGFGNINHPGTGHPPPIRNATPPNASFPARLGANIAGHPDLGPNRGGGRRVVPVGIAIPVYVGGPGYGPGYGYGDYGSGYGAGYGAPMPQQAPPPTIIINNNSYVPDTGNLQVREYTAGSLPAPGAPGMREYQAPQGVNYPDPNAPPPEAKVTDRPTVYLIALKDGSVYSAVAYWVEEGTLHYITTQHSQNRASLDLVDLRTTQQLNDERKVDFRLQR